MISVLELMTEAREWLGTPYHDQGSLKGVGCDCVGLFTGIARELKVPLVERHDYAPEPSGPELLSYLRQNCTRLEIVEPTQTLEGTILAFKIRDDAGPHHLALRTKTGMIHAVGSGNRGRVHEGSLKWRDQLHSVWWYPKVAH